ncbi:MAG: YaiI/YqxD family protein [Pseudomonas sp.]|uniref:YaiI/YqxD family protein n=1 Tax=Pseudomonas sp. TaxID=306 RepID=UPI003D10F994
MRVWIDADACPKAAKDQVIKFALKRKLEVLLVAGQSQIKPAFACVRLIVVPSGPDAADDYLVEHAVPGELVICSDVPLADRLVKKGVAALDPRGREFDERNMGERLAVRNLFTDLREQGQVGGGQAPYGEREKQAFANALDRILTRLARAYPG